MNKYFNINIFKKIIYMSPKKSSSNFFSKIMKMFTKKTRKNKNKKQNRKTHKMRGG